MAFSLDFRAHSETGLVRKNNQDSAYASPTALVVADGMGGAAAGDLASAIAIHEIARADRPLQGEDMLEAFTGAVANANHLLADLVAEEPVLDGMGTTVCGAFFSGEQVAMVHIGDSRAYLWRDGRLTRLSHDHSWVQSLVDEGRLHEEDMSTHPHRSLLLRVLNGQTSSEPDTSMIDVQLDDRLLFCSDGLCGFTTDAEIARLMALPDLDEVVPGMIQAAHAGGGADNISFVVADVVPRSEELDAREPVMLGAVTDGDLAQILAEATQSTLDVPPPPISVVPRHEPASDPQPVSTRAPMDADRASRSTARSATAVDDEHLRYVPSRQRRRWVPTVALLGCLVLLLAGAGVGGLLYSRSQFYVGTAPTSDGDAVAIFRGLPDQVLGLKLSNVQEVDETLVADLPSYYRQQVAATIQADNLDSAKQTAQQLHLMAAKCTSLRAAATASASSASAASASAASASASRASASRASASAAKKSSGTATASARASSATKAPASTATKASASATATPGASASPSASSTAADSASPLPNPGDVSVESMTLQDCS